MKKRKKKKSKNHWALAKIKYRLNSRQIAMAKELGMNPKKFWSLIPNKLEPWKESLGVSSKNVISNDTKDEKYRMIKASMIILLTPSFARSNDRPKISFECNR